VKFYKLNAFLYSCNSAKGHVIIFNYYNCNDIVVLASTSSRMWVEGKEHHVLAAEKLIRTSSLRIKWPPATASFNTCIYSLKFQQPCWWQVVPGHPQRLLGFSDGFQLSINTVRNLKRRLM